MFTNICAVGIDMGYKVVEIFIAASRQDFSFQFYYVI